MVCVICGSDDNVQTLAGRLLCTEHRDSLQRRRCAAVTESSGARRFRGLKRCARNAFGEDELCAAHKRVKAQVQQWELCPKCRKVDRIVGGKCYRCDS